MNQLAENKMGTRPIGPLLISMALPMIASMLMQALYNVVDSIFVSQVSEAALTAVGLAFPIQNLMIAVGVGTGVGVNALLSKSLGEKNFDQADRAADNGIFLALVSTVVFMVLGGLFSGAYFRMQNVSQAVGEAGTAYLTIVTVVSIGVFGQTMMEKLLSATGRTMLSMICQMVGAVTNIILDPIMIFGLLGCPAMGVAGAAWATVIGQCLAFALGLYLQQFHNKEVKLTLRGDLPAARRYHPPDLRDRVPQHRHDERGQRDDLLHEPGIAGVFRNGHRGVRRILQAAEFRVHAGIWYEQRHGAHHQLQLRRAASRPDAGHHAAEHDPG